MSGVRGPIGAPRTMADGKAGRARVAVLISGRGSNMAALVYAAKQADCPFEIVLVASNNPEAAGLQLAEAEGIPTFAHSHKGMKRADYDRLIDAAIRRAGATHVALAGYMRLLSPEFVEGWQGRMLNIHPSLLPRYKGLDTHQRALDAGDRVAGCSVHVVTAELDDGPVLGQTEVAILDGDTAQTLADRILIAEHQLYGRVLAAFVGGPANPALLLERVRAIALALPVASEKMSHGVPAFAAAGKMFLYFRNNHHGDGMVSICVKTTGREEQEMLIDTDPDLYSWPSYIGPSGWIAMRLDRRDLDWDHVADRILTSWRHAAPRAISALL